ncbi:gas vesicle protein GcpK [Candidatus Nitrososphaera gargensis Ga9.2]|uniref:Gas vesicle protein GcpK n=1 Tax=Nitrososphaera gargensis (strain Ga9.2) TaxID=1237085 RepID=K0INC5_NITGG|nr:gas vesicle protein K [Candidatus Nitrososphaera gargensis]AFU59134.1 gas vesicle protein GcpK [Candidatus Nitrososphaera gargensis Ga9.2]
MDTSSVDSNNNNNILLALEKKPEGPDAEKLQHGLAKLVLTLVQTMTDILERQAVRRVESGTLTAEEVERLGLAFMQIRERTADIADKFGVKPEELSIRFQQQSENQRQVTIVDVVDKLIDQGTVIAGDVTLVVAGVDLATLRLLATLTAKK